MDMKVLCVGDVVAEPGMDRISRSLRYLIQKTNADFTIVNGENADIVGISPRNAKEILDSGADVITLGNHTYKRREIVPFLQQQTQILRPANLPAGSPGLGYHTYETKFGPVAVIDLMGMLHMEYGCDNPFHLVERVLKDIDAKIILVEFHGEATSEKLAMAYMLKGKISALWGTHTHVPTADAQVLPGGTGYVTDLGMTGAANSILGVRPEQSIARFRGELTERFRWAPGPTKLEAVLFTIDSTTGRCKKAERVDLYENTRQR